MKQRTARVIHLSDLHFGKTRHAEPQRFKMHIGRGSADPRVATLLSEYIRTLEYEAFVVSGDLTATGTKDECFVAKSWIRMECETDTRRKDVVVVPGNHDAFAGNLTQTSLAVFHEEFPDVDYSRPRCVTVCDGEIGLEFHAFDTTLLGKKAFGEGHFKEDDRDISVETNRFHVAVLHHAPLPILSRGGTKTRDMRLQNEKTALRYFLGRPFEALLFGHYHDGFFEELPRHKILSRATRIRGKTKLGLLQQARTIAARFIGNGTAKTEPEFIDDWLCSGGISRKTRSGRYVSLTSIVEMLEICSERGLDPLKSKLNPGKHSTPKAFYAALAKHRSGKPESGSARKTTPWREKIACSMAPSTLDATAEIGRRMFHLLCFRFTREGNEDPWRLDKVDCEVHTLGENGTWGARVEKGHHAIRIKA